MLTPIPFPLQMIIMGNNQVAIDAVCCHIIGVDPAQVPHIKLTADNGFGPLDLGQIKIAGDLTLEQAQARARGFKVGLIRVEKYFEGTHITERSVDHGHLVQAARSSADNPLFVLIQADTVRLFIDVPEADAALVETGRKARITVSAIGNAAFDGIVARTGWALQTGTRSLRCEVDVPNSDGKLRPGMYAQVELAVAERTDALTVPKSAVVVKDGQSFCVSVSTDGSILRLPVHIGIRSATDVEILSGLDGTEDVLTANAAAFSDGQKVEKTSP